MNLNGIILNKATAHDYIKAHNININTNQIQTIPLWTFEIFADTTNLW